MKKRSFDVELGWIREFALREKRQYCPMRFFHLTNFLS